VVIGEKNSPTESMQFVKGDQNEYPVLGGIAGLHCPGGYEYGGLTIQVGGPVRQATTCHLKKARFFEA